jgi:hypothetical protein
MMLEQQNRMEYLKRELKEMGELYEKYESEDQIASKKYQA